jgi:hypothetical protein
VLSEQNRKFILRNLERKRQEIATCFSEKLSSLPFVSVDVYMRKKREKGCTPQNMQNGGLSAFSFLLLF